jgi:hypothetical protein
VWKQKKAIAKKVKGVVTITPSIQNYKSFDFFIPSLTTRFIE